MEKEAILGLYSAEGTSDLNRMQIKQEKKIMRRS